MATYKVLQDIEAEDKLVGPLTLQQFIYALVAALNFYLAFLVSSRGAVPLAAIFVPIGAIAAFFAWPFARDQPTEVWALARIKFLMFPRKRIWDQSGVKELVTITVPKKVERHLTNGLSENEVKSRLQALADTIDSRGWAIKNVNVSMIGQPALVTGINDSDRLVGAGSLPQPVETVDVKSSDDILDEKNNPVAKHFDSMMAASAKAHREEIMTKLKTPSTPLAPPPAPTPAQPVHQNDYWFLNQPAQQASSVQQDAVTFNTQVVAPGAPATSLPVSAATPTQDEESFIKSHKNEPAFSPNMHGHLHVIQPLSAQQATATAQTNAAAAGQQQPMPMPQPPAAGGQNATVPPVTQARDTAILKELSRNDDLNVATLAREAHKRTEQADDSEVVISLH